MTLIEDKGNCKIYEGKYGKAVIIRNFGNMDKTDKWQVAVEVNGQYKQLAKRAVFQKALALAEQEIG